MKHALPPTIFFLVGFNLIVLTKRLILEEHSIEFTGFFAATVAALPVGTGGSGNRQFALHASF